MALYLELGAPFTVYGNRIAHIIFNCFFAIGIIISNFLVIGVVLSKKELRQNSKYVLVALLAFTELYIGLFSLPVYINNLVTETFDYTCTELLVIQGGSYIKLAMSCLAIVSIHIDTILQISNKAYHGTCRVVTTCILALFFLVGPFIVLIPIYVTGKFPSLYNSCELSMKLSYAIAAGILSYWLPVLCIIVTTIVVCVVHQRARRQQGYIGQQQQQTSPSTTLIDLVIVAVVTVGAPLPSYILSAVGCGGSCQWYPYLLIVFDFISASRAFLVPLAWCANMNFMNIVLGRRPPVNQPAVSQSAPHYSQQQYMTSPVQGQTPSSQASVPAFKQ